MSYRLPTFPLTCDIYRGQGRGGVYGVPDNSSPCNLTPGARNGRVSAATPQISVISYHLMTLLLPALTDIRASWNSILNDIVEVPAGTGRFYTVQYVDDVAKGFANEHRFAIINYSTITYNLFVGDPGRPVPLP